MKLILASTSPYRRAQIECLGVPFQCVAPTVDENVLKQAWGEVDPQGLAEHLAAAKARSISALDPEATVIGGDQLVDFDGRVLGKPGTVQGANDQLNAMAGRSHRLISALAVEHEGRTYVHTEVTVLTMRPLTRAEIARYVDAEQPLDCAGSYKIEGRGITLFESIQTADQTAIIGVPLIGLTTILRGLGFAVP